MIAKRMSSVGECFIVTHGRTYYGLILQSWVWPEFKSKNGEFFLPGASCTSLRALHYWIQLSPNQFGDFASIQDVILTVFVVIR